jgi:hypothetical protein
MYLHPDLASEPLRLEERLYEILARVDALAILDERSEEEILGYDADGLPR